MKKIKNISVLLLGIFTMISCSEVEPIDPAIVLNPNPTNPNNPNNPNDPGTSTGDYWPAALDNQWVFERNGVTQPAMKIVSINSLNGHTYYTFNEQTGSTPGGLTGSAVTRLRKTGADYYLKVEDFVMPPIGGVPGSTTSGSETILLRDNLPVGGTWTSSYTQTTTYTNPMFPVMEIDFVINGTIMEKGSEIVVADETYTDVIKTKYVQTTTMAGQTTSTTSYYWFAKDVGPIRVVTETDPVDYDSVLTSYILN